MPKKWYSTKETCEHLGIHRNTLQLQREDGTIPKKYWKVKNPKAIRLTYQYDLKGLDNLPQQIAQLPSQKTKILGTQPAFLDGVKP